MSDIVERLRGWAAVERHTASMTLVGRGSQASVWLTEAADEIERLRDVIARCDAEIAALHDQALRSDAEIEGLRRALQALAWRAPELERCDAEIERLRALLREVAASVVLTPGDPVIHVEVQMEAETWAALEEFRTDHHDQET